MRIYIELLYDELTVELEPIYETQDDSYNDEYGLVQFPKYMAVMDFEFNEKKYTPFEVSEIKNYIDKNFSDLQKIALDEYEEPDNF